MIIDPKFFVGRREELDFITSRMTAAQPTSINVVGERQIGKSSLLYHFFQTYEQRVQRYGKNPGNYVVVYLSLQDAHCRQEVNFYQAVAQKLLNRPVVQANPALTAPLQSASLDRQSFSAAINAWKAENVLPVVCLDKFEKLLHKPQEFNDEFYDNLRSLMDRNALMLVVASYRNLDIYRRQYRFLSSFFNLGHVLPLGGMTEAEATELVRLPETKIAGATAALSLERQKLGLDWGKRHPFLLQLAGCWLWEAQQQNRPHGWARQKFEQEAQGVSQSGVAVRWWQRPMQLLLWLPLGLRRIAGAIGNRSDDISNLLSGTLILIMVILALLQVVPAEELLKRLKDALEGEG
ncbi:ATP-binding protein [Coleofasciculus sp. LEGE 07092]|nr:ATP-binding protein [Coleofasciculus sp. LEGE 07081]MBE9148069.1 ATP-binding protein [Coleofasciculus sp. LEGE 07092]